MNYFHMRAYVVVSVLLLAASILTGCNNSENHALEETKNATMWETYIDVDHGFELTYRKSKDSYIATDGRHTGLIFSLSKDGVEALYITFETNITKNTATCESGFTEAGEVTIGEVVSTKCVHSEGTDTIAWYTTLQNETSSGVETYAFTCSGELNDFPEYCEDVLSSFHFIK